jgi:hypothetical protein
MTEWRSRGEPGGAKAQRAKLQCRLRYLLAARILPGVRTEKSSLRAASRHRPVALASEGLRLDRCQA